MLQTAVYRRATKTAFSPCIGTDIQTNTSLYALPTYSKRLKVGLSSRRLTKVNRSVWPGQTDGAPVPSIEARFRLRTNDFFLFEFNARCELSDGAGLRACTAPSSQVEQLCGRVVLRQRARRAGALGRALSLRRLPIGASLRWHVV